MTDEEIRIADWIIVWAIIATILFIASILFYTSVLDTYEEQINQQAEMINELILNKWNYKPK